MWRGVAWRGVAGMWLGLRQKAATAGRQLQTAADNPDNCTVADLVDCQLLDR